MPLASPCLQSLFSLTHRPLFDRRVEHGSEFEDGSMKSKAEVVAE